MEAIAPTEDMQEPTEEPASPFQVLSVPLDADDGTVRKAFAKLLREARGRSDSGAVERIQRAFEAIRDEEPRRRLRKVLEERDRFEEPLEAARGLAGEGDLRGARLALRRILEKVPLCEPVLAELFQVEVALAKLDAAAVTARKLIQIAPGNGDYWVLSASALADHAYSLDDQPSRERHFQLALRHARKARDLKGDGPALDVLESRILEALGRHRASSELLQSRLASAEEWKSPELEIAFELLRKYSNGMGRKFQEALDSIARAIPDDPEKRRTMARGLCGVAGDLLAGLRPSAALECARLAEICTPGDPGVERLIAACEKHQGRIEKKLEAVAMTVIDETNRQAASQRRWGAFLAAWRTWIIAIVLIKLFAFGMRGCFHSSRHTPSRLDETRIQKKYGEDKRRSGRVSKEKPRVKSDDGEPAG